MFTRNNIAKGLAPASLTAIIVSGVAFLLLNLLTYMYSDDYPFSFTFCSTGVDLTNPIKISGIFKSQYLHYFTQHGRVFTTGMGQLLMVFRDKHVFDVCNTIVFVLFLYLIQLYSASKNWAVIPLALVLILGISRAFGETFLWMAGSVNYLWGGSLNLVLLYIIRHYYYESITIWRAIGLTVFSFIVGTWQESFSIGVGASLLLCLSYRRIRRKELPAIPWMMAIAYILGIVFYVVSPGTQRRASSAELTSQYDIMRFVDGVLYVLIGLRIFWVLLIVVVMRLIWSKYRLGDILTRNGGFLIAIVFEMLFLFFVGRAAQARAFFGIEMFSLIVLLRLVSPVSKRMGVLAGIIAFAIYCPVLFLTMNNHKIMQQYFEEMKDSEGLVFFDNPKYSRLERHYFGSMLFIDHRGSMFKYEAAYFNKRRLLTLPKRFREELFLSSSFICPENELQPGIYAADNMEFVIKPLPINIPLPKSRRGCEYVAFPSGNYALLY